MAEDAIVRLRYLAAGRARRQRVVHERERGEASARSPLVVGAAEVRRELGDVEASALWVLGVLKSRHDRA